MNHHRFKQELLRVSRETFLLPVRVYQAVSRTILPARCKFYPTCSAYCVDAVRHRGIIVGAILTMMRVLRCHPYSRGGYDPVPAHGTGRRERRDWHAAARHRQTH